MITISGTTLQFDELIKKISVTGKGRQILKQLDKSSEDYSYPSLKDLESSILIREDIIEAAQKLNKSKAIFTVFEHTKANDKYWSVTKNGGIRLREGVKPSDAIRDIFKNGAKYGFECATAMVIVYYHAALNFLGDKTFNKYFMDLYLYSWQTDSDLGLTSIKVKDPVPGDVVYFNNPDYIKPEWRGENSVFLGDNLYYGHGMGILNKNEMMETLDRLGESSEEDSYMLDKIVRPSFNEWIKLKQGNTMAGTTLNTRALHENIYHHNLTSISYYYYCSQIRKLNKEQIKITINGN